MEIQTRSEAGLLILELSGRTTILDGVEPLRAAFKRSMAEGHLNYLFDLRELLFIDSASIGEMIACLKQASDKAGSVRLLLKSGGSIDDVVTISGVSQIFDVYYDPAVAIQREG